MTTWQFTRFRVTPAREPEVLRARRESLRSCWTGYPALQAAYLVQLAEGDWLDITVWAGRECDPAAEPADPALPASRTAFFDQIDELIGEECGLVISEDAPHDQRS